MDAASFTSNAVWYWQSNTDPFSTTQKPEWTPYSADNNKTIEHAYSSHKKNVKLGNSHIIDLESYLQINANDRSRVRPVRREFTEQKHYFTTDTNFGVLRKERFFYPPKFTKSFQEVTEKGSSFIRSSGFLDMQHMPTEQACHGILFEGKKLPDSHNVAKQLADELKNESTDLSRLCIRLYTEQTFLYSLLNKALRENDLSKVSTLGPYASMLYQALVRSPYKVYNTTVYRGANLTDEMIEEYKTSIGELGKWLAFSSTTRNRDKAFGENTLFIIHIKQPVLIDCGFDIASVSAFPEEEEVLLLAGGRFKIDRVEYENGENMIYMTVF